MSLLSCALVHHTGTIIRFRTSQLPQLPSADSDVMLLLPYGSVVQVHFRRNPANPNLSGTELVQYIKRRLRFGEKRTALVETSETGVWRLFELDHAEDAARTHGLRISDIRRGQLSSRSLAAALARIDALRDAKERRRGYSHLLRPAILRRLMLDVFGASCQVESCAAPEDFVQLWNDAAAGRAIVEVHHIEAVALCVDHHPTNLCTLCANHHQLVHGYGPWSVIHEQDDVILSRSLRTMRIRRDLSVLRRQA